jgi:hypothetical protein
MNNVRRFFLLGVLILSLTLVGMALAADNLVQNTNSGSNQSVDQSTTSFQLFPDTPQVNLPTEAVIDSDQSDMVEPYEGRLTQVGPGITGSVGSSGFGNPQSVLWDNGPLMTNPGACGGMDASRLQTNLSMNTLGFGHQFSLGYRMADDFTVSGPESWYIQQITFFAYQSNAPISPSPITAVYYQIWDGPPNDPLSNIVFGDLVTNRLLSSVTPNLQRDSGTNLCANNRYIFANVASAGVALAPGTYWIDWTTDGNPSYSGPWAPPITILGETTTGNALQYTTDWAAALDSGTLTQQGLPFVIEGLFAEPEIEVTPTSLFADQPANTVTTQQLQICNLGGDVLPWSISEVLLHQQGNILLIDTFDTLSSVQLALNQLGYYYEYIQAADWTGIDFSSYQIVIVAMDGGLINSPSLEKLRTDVIDAGKHLIFLGGTCWQDFALGVNQYLVANNTADYCWKISATPHFTLVDPSNPLAEGLPSPYNFIDNNAAYYQTRVTDPSIDVIGVNGDGHASLFYKDTNFPLNERNSTQQSGDFVWFIDTPASPYWSNPDDFAFLKQLLENAIHHSFVMNDQEWDLSVVAGFKGETSLNGENLSAVGSSMPVKPITVELSPEVSSEITVSSSNDHIVQPSQAAVESVLWDQPLSIIEQSAYVDQDFIDFPDYTSFLADDFVNADPWLIQSIFIPGDGWGGFSTLLNATTLTWQIYEDNAGVPAGDPTGAGAPPLWTLSLAPSDPRVSITPGTSGYLSNTQLNLMTPISLPPGHYWLIFYPKMSFAGAGQYGRQPADTTHGYIPQLINPGGGFGFGTDWQGWNVLGAPLTDMAFTLGGEIGEPAGIPWLTEIPPFGQVPPAECITVDVNFNSTGLNIGNYYGLLRINSNDADEPFINIPVTLHVNTGFLYLPLIHKP